MDYKDCVDKILQGAKELAEMVGDKTKQTASSVKIEIDLKRAEQELDKAYKTMGRIMYRIENGSLKRDEQIIKAACQQIKMQEELIEKLSQEKEEVKKGYREGDPVDVEGREVEPGAQEAEDQPKPKKNQDGYFVLKFCPYCKVGNHPDATKCVSCGRDI